MDRTNEKAQPDELGATAESVPTKYRGATVESSDPNGRPIRSCFMSLHGWESQRGAERFECVDDLYRLRFWMPDQDLVKLAMRVESLLAAHDQLAADHIASVARYQAMAAELRSLLGEGSYAN